MTQGLEMTKNGITVPVHINTMLGGRFEATVGDRLLTAPTWPELEKQLDKATRRVSRKVDVPFTTVRFRRVDGRTVVSIKQGSATGLHSGTGHVLVRYEDGTREQLTGWKSLDANLFRPLSREDVEEYAALYRAAREASDALARWGKAHEIDLKAEVTGALDKETSGTD